MGRTEMLGGCLGHGHSAFSVGCRRVLVLSASSHNRSNLLFALVTEGSSKAWWISPLLCCFYLVCSEGHTLFTSLLSALLQGF